MEIEQDCSIFDYIDIADLIFDKLDFDTITEVAVVCKRFAALSKDHLQKHLKDEIIDPARQIYDEFYINYMHLYLSHQYYGFLYRMNIDHFIRMLKHFESFIYPFINNKFWILFLYDLDAMDNIFVFVSRLNHIIQFNKNYIFFNTNIGERKNMYHRINKIFDSINKYLYVEYPNRYINSDLQMMARFKKIDKHWCMNKSKLSKVLRRPLVDLDNVIW